MACVLLVVLVSITCHSHGSKVYLFRIVTPKLTGSLARSITSNYKHQHITPILKNQLASRQTTHTLTIKYASSHFHISLTNQQPLQDLYSLLPILQLHIHQMHHAPIRHGDGTVVSVIVR